MGSGDAVTQASDINLQDEGRLPDILQITALSNSESKKPKKAQNCKCENVLSCPASSRLPPPHSIHSVQFENLRWVEPGAMQFTTFARVLAYYLFLSLKYRPGAGRPSSILIVVESSVVS